MVTGAIKILTIAIRQKNTTSLPVVILLTTSNINNNSNIGDPPLALELGTVRNLGFPPTGLGFRV